MLEDELYYPEVDHHPLLNIYYHLDSVIDDSRKPQVKPEYYPYESLYDRLKNRFDKVNKKYKKVEPIVKVLNFLRKHWSEIALYLSLYLSLEVLF